jgi:hypothetical protein
MNSSAAKGRIAAAKGMALAPNEADQSAERIRNVEGRDVCGGRKLRRGLPVFHHTHLHRGNVGEGRDAEDEGGRAFARPVGSQ